MGKVHSFFVLFGISSAFFFAAACSDSKTLVLQENYDARKAVNDELCQARRDGTFERVASYRLSYNPFSYNFYPEFTLVKYVAPLAKDAPSFWPQCQDGDILYIYSDLDLIKSEYERNGLKSKARKKALEEYQKNRP